MLSSFKIALRIKANGTKANLNLGECESGAGVSVKDFLDGVGVGGRAKVQIQIIFVRRVDDSSRRSFHRVGETRVDDVLFRGAGDSFLERFVGRDRNRTLAERLLQRVLNALQQQIIAFLFVFERQSTVADVIQIFQPFEIRYGNTSGVDKQIGNDQSFILN